MLTVTADETVSLLKGPTREDKLVWDKWTTNLSIRCVIVSYVIEKFKFSYFNKKQTIIVLWFVVWRWIVMWVESLLNVLWSTIYGHHLSFTLWDVLVTEDRNRKNLLLAVATDRISMSSCLAVITWHGLFFGLCSIKRM